MLIIHNCAQRQEEHSKRDKDEALSSLRLRMCNSERTHAHARLQDITGVKAHKLYSLLFLFIILFLNGYCWWRGGTCPPSSVLSLVTNCTATCHHVILRRNQPWILAFQSGARRRRCPPCSPGARMPRSWSPWSGSGVGRTCRTPARQKKKCKENKITMKKKSVSFWIRCFMCSPIREFLACCNVKRKRGVGKHTGTHTHFSIIAIMLGACEAVPFRGRGNY